MNSYVEVKPAAKVNCSKVQKYKLQVFRNHCNNFLTILLRYFPSVAVRHLGTCWSRSSCFHNRMLSMLRRRKFVFSLRQTSRLRAYTDLPYVSISWCLIQRRNLEGNLCNEALPVSGGRRPSRDRIPTPFIKDGGQHITTIEE